MTDAGALDLEQFAALTAKAEAGVPTERALREADVTPEQWLQAQEFWLSKMADLAAAGQLTLHQRYLDRLAEHRRAETDEQWGGAEQAQGDLPAPPAPRISPQRSRSRRAAARRQWPVAPLRRPASPSAHTPSSPPEPPRAAVAASSWPPAAHPSSLPPPPAEAPSTPRTDPDRSALYQTACFEVPPVPKPALPFAESRRAAPSSTPPPPDDRALPFRRSEPPPAPASAVPSTQPLPEGQRAGAKSVTLPFEAVAADGAARSSSSRPPPPKEVAPAEELFSTMVVAPDEAPAAAKQALPFVAAKKSKGASSSAPPAWDAAPDPPDHPLGSTMVVTPEEVAAARRQALPFATPAAPANPAMDCEPEDPLARTVVASSAEAAAAALSALPFAATKKPVAPREPDDSLFRTVVASSAEAAGAAASALPFVSSPDTADRSSSDRPPADDESSNEPAQRVAPLTVQQYAWLSATIERSPDRQPQLLAMLGLTAKSKAYVDSYWAREFERDRSKKEAFEQALEAQRAKRREPDDG